MLIKENLMIQEQLHENTVKKIKAKISKTEEQIASKQVFFMHIFYERVIFRVYSTFSHGYSLHVNAKFLREHGKTAVPRISGFKKERT